MIFGVDRLDYTKGIPDRLKAFARLLEQHPEWRDPRDDGPGRRAQPRTPEVAIRR